MVRELWTGMPFGGKCLVLGSAAVVSMAPALAAAGYTGSGTAGLVAAAWILAGCGVAIIGRAHLHWSGRG